MLKIDTLPSEQRLQAYREYENKKKSKTSGYIAWFFGCFRLYTYEVLPWIVFVISLFFGIGFLRWFIDLFFVSSHVVRSNQKLDDRLYEKYKG